MCGRLVLQLIWLTVQLLQCFNAAAVVNTPVGEIRGKATQVTVDGISYTVNQYLGIPFAQPPIGDLRFRKPQSLTQLQSPFNASAFGNICPQIGVPRERVDGVESEDCLYLNVYAPLRNADQTSGHAVMVFIYGGSFILGSSNTYPGAHLAAYGNVIYVSVNYRVGPFGFLSTMDEISPGNYGLWDQRLALQWIHDNIMSFGGDKDRVTIFGESAGAISVVMQGMYPPNQGLFQRIVAESGVAEVKFIHMTRDTSDTVNVIAQRVGCERTNNREIIDCMRQVNWVDYMQVVNEMANDPNTIQYLNYDPVLDNDFVKYDPKKLSKLSKEREIDEIEFFRSFDFINGFNQYEGGVFMSYFMDTEDPNDFSPTPESMRTSLIPMALMISYEREFPAEIYDAVAHEYTDWADPYNSEVIRVQYASLHGDAGFSVPAVSTSRLHAAKTQANSYMFTFLPIPTHRFPTTPGWLPGADHGDELAYILGIESLQGVTEWEKQLSYTMMTYWSNFAKSGNPNIPDGSGPTWQPYTVENQHYMELDRNMGAHSSKQYLLAGETHFWQEVLPGIVERMDGHDSVGTCDTNSGVAVSSQLTTFGAAFIMMYVLRMV